MIKKILKWGFLILLVAFIVIQFINRPDKVSSAEITNDDITKKLAVPENVQGIMKRACYDCHSNQTKWPWYSNIAPASWLVADDIKEGRKKMNFSEWGKIPESKRQLRLENICEEVQEGKMPLPKYLIMHKEAELTQADKEVLCNWVKSVSGE